LIALALTDLSRVLYGTNIRITELIKNLGIPVVFSRTQTRILKYLKYGPSILKNKDLLLFGSRGRIFDDLFLNGVRLLKSRIIYDAADLPHLQNYYFGGGVIDPGLARRFYSLVDCSSILVVVSQSALRLFEPKTLKSKQTVIVPNGCDPEIFKAAPLESRIRTVLYVGGYAPNRGVDDLVDAFKSLGKKHPDIRLRLVGASIPLKFNSDRITVEHDKIYKDMPTVYSQSHLCVIPHRRNPYMDAASPVKLYEAMAAGRPLVVTNCTEMKNLVEAERCGVIADNDSASLAEAIEYLVLHPKTAREMGMRGREAALERHSWQIRAEKLRLSLTKSRD
jgi:glycosyltransferase involved in cell wall biosynthesis